MQFASALTHRTDVRHAVDELAAAIREQLGDQQPDFLQVFVTRYFEPTAAIISEALRAALGPGVLLGCTAESVVGRDMEVERLPAISVVAAVLPDVSLTPFALHGDELQAAIEHPDIFRQQLSGLDDPQLFVMLADPFSTPVSDLLAAFNLSYPGVPVVGGMASGAVIPRGNRLMLDDMLVNVGAVGVTFSGSLSVDVIVSQGCRPVGAPCTVTAAEGNAIIRLENQQPVAAVQALFDEMSPDDQQLVQNGLYIGRAVRQQADSAPGRGDFLIRGVLGADQNSGALIVGDVVPTGETIQFHLRDAATAREDLELLLIPQAFSDPPSGALLFTCNGRGTRLYDHPNGDIAVIQDALGGVPLAGFFAAGEIGPVGERNFLHGHTASLVLFRPGS